jgi:type II secretory pathway pseudopilin PulG
MLKNKSETGFTLIEVIIANIILMTLVLAGLGFFQYCSVAAKNAKIRLFGVNYARETMEIGYFDGLLTDTGGWVNDPLNVSTSYGDELSQANSGKREYRVRPSGSNNYLIYEVRVTWND